MTELRDRLRGLWLPLVTPFRDGAIDELSLRRLVRHYAKEPIDGFILGASSGEGLSLATDEMEQLVSTVRGELAALTCIMPVCLGLAGAATQKMQEMLDETASWPIDGYLISAPYYLKPSQRGLLAHFAALADHASWPIVLYNIPYRTSVNIANDTLLRLAQHPNIVGLKDCSADRAIDRSTRAAAGRFSSADWRGRAIFRRALRRCRWRDSAVGPCRDRDIRAHSGPIEGR